MLYVIYSEDVPNSLPMRKRARAAHIERLQALLDNGRLIIAGPCPAIDSDDPGEAGFTGSVIIAEFTDLPAAQAWADADPYIEAGVYRKVSVKPYKQALP